MISHGDGRKEFVGCVVREMERNGHDDSDFYALVYDRFASCPDCRGTGWKLTDGEVAETYQFGSYSDSAVSYGLTLTLMDGSYAHAWIPNEDGRGGHAVTHPYADSRKFLTPVVSYMGIPDGFSCETCSGSGKIDHPDGGWFHWVEWGTTRFACDAHCSVDATDEVKALHKEWVESNRIRMKAGLERIKGTKIGRGKRVRVVRGRKVPIGTEGEIFWHGADKYASRWSKSNDEFARVGIVTDDGEKFFLSGSNVEVLVDLTGDGDWVPANDLVMPGDSIGLSMTPEHWVYSSGFYYAG